MSLRLISYGAEQVGHGAAPCGQYGREHQDEKPVIRGCGKRGSKYAEYWHCTHWYVHVSGPFMGFTIAYWPRTLAAISP
jgi:hypothetical protein